MNQDFVYFVISGFVIMTIPILLIAWFQAGFFMKWLKVRASRGKLTLVKVRGKLMDYWEWGQIRGTFLIYGVGEHKKRMVIDDGVVYRCLGVTVVDTDETNNATCKVDYTAVTGFDASKFEDLYVRALFRPILDANPNSILIILLVIVLAGLGINALMTWNLSQQISAMLASSVTGVV